MLTLALVSRLVLAMEPGELAITAQPEGTQIIVDAETVGTSENGRTLVVPVKAGTHLIRYAYDGHVKKQEVYVRSGKRQDVSYTFVLPQR